MAAVEVARLKLRCDARQEGQARFAVEDALRTEIPDDGRLVLLRRMQIAPAGSSALPAQRQAAVRDAWAAATGGARHGREDGAGEANCVWFASRAEAEAILLARLLAGRTADGWFWKLALPGWRGQPVAEWLGESLCECLGSGDDRRLLAIVEACVEAGAVEALITAVAQAGQTSPERRWPRGSPFAAAPAPGKPLRRDAAAPDKVAEIAEAIPMPDTLRVVVQRLVGSLRAPTAARAILRAHVLRESPALALSPVLIEAVIVALEAAITGTGPAAPLAAPDAKHGPPTVEPGKARDTNDVAPSADANMPIEAASAQTDPASPMIAQEASSDPAPRSEAPPPQPTPSPIVPVRSEHAGLWLVVPSLCDMGLRNWLADRPELLGDHPGRQLILAIARHYRVADDDPALAVLGEVNHAQSLPEWTALWRHGLDRWLRRNARRRLHDLVHRPGRLDWDEQRLSIIFPPGDADIRLRRLALDRDPGWTDWLGLSIRFNFRDEVPV